MRRFAMLMSLLGSLEAIKTAPAASNDCSFCRKDREACSKNHSQGACKSEYEICMKHCRRR